MAIFKDCEQRAHAVRESRRAESVRTIDRLHEAQRDRKSDEVTEYSDRLRELEQPIADSFEEQLKARLDALPTAEQRQAVKQTENTDRDKPWQAVVKVWNPPSGPRFRREKHSRGRLCSSFTTC